MPTIPATLEDTDHPKPTWLIRSADSTDAEALGRLHVQCWRSGYAGLIAADYLADLDEGEFIARWRGRLSRSEAERRTFLALAATDGRLIGFTEVATQGEAASLESLYVDDRFWGAGVGYALHRSGLDWLIANGCRRAGLWVLSGNTRAASFYRRQGWTSNGTTKIDDRGVVQLAEFQMIMELHK